jgi:hypothetical protein
MFLPLGEHFASTAHTGINFLGGLSEAIQSPDVSLCWTGASAFHAADFSSGTSFWLRFAG